MKYIPTIVTAFLLLLASVLPLSTVHAGLNEWTTSGPGGGGLQALAVDPLTPTTLDAGPSGGVIRMIGEDGGDGLILGAGFSGGSPRLEQRGPQRELVIGIPVSTVRVFRIDGRR